jgi:hypothetical protein
MADKTPKYPPNTVMQYPDGSHYVYAKAASEFTSGTYIEPNAAGLLVKFKGGLTFPQGIVIETVPEDHWTFVMVRPPQVVPTKKSEIVVPI